VSHPAYRAVVIGGGVVGLATAWHLLRLGCRPIAVLERFRIGHDRGSSHGSVRMTRSTYTTAPYVRLMRHVHEQEWPRLERAAGVTLVHPRDVVFFGPDHAALAAYAGAVRAAGANVERVEPVEARRRFPSLRITDDAAVLQDRTGGTIAADDTVRALHRLVASDAAVREGTRVLAIERGDRAIRIATDGGVVEAERVAIATGAWLPELVPSARAALTVVPQTVAYFRLAVPATTVPSWIHFGGGDSGVAYGLAELGRDAMKVGRHVTGGAGADPDAPGSATPGELAALRARLEEVLTVPVGDLLDSESCLYTMTGTEDFAIAAWPGDARVAFASACSGHGFKFAPLAGRLLAELVINGRMDTVGGTDVAALFALHRGADSAREALAGRPD
jgi:sarcosine oxidase